MSHFVSALIGAAIGAPVGLWLHAWATAKVQVRRWQKIVDAYALDGEGD